MKAKKYATLLLDPPFETMQSGTYGACKHSLLRPVTGVSSQSAAVLDVAKNGVVISSR